MNKIDKIFEGFASEITKQPTITIKDGNNDKRYFTFATEKLNHLEKELKKHYGDKIVGAIIKEIKKAIEGNYLKQFANDRSVDFIIKDGQLQSVFKQKSSSIETDEGSEEEVVTEELSAEIIKGATTKMITVTASDKGVIRKYFYSKEKGLVDNNGAVPTANLKEYPEGSAFMKKVILNLKAAINNGDFDGNDGKPDIVLKFDKTGKMLDIKPVITKDPL